MSRATSKTVTIKIATTMVKPNAVYRMETWPMTVTDMKRLNTRERKIIRRIKRPVVKQ